MALEHGICTTECAEIKDNLNLDLEEVQITPPVRRKKKEAKKNKADLNGMTSGDERIPNTDDGAADCNPAISAVPNPAEMETNDAKQNTDVVLSPRESTIDVEMCVMECNPLVENDSHGEVHGNAAACQVTSFDSGMENSSEDKGGLVGSPFETSSILDTSEQEDVGAEDIKCVSRHESCISTDFRSGEQASQDEESFFSADSDAEATSSELVSSAPVQDLKDMLISSSNVNEEISSCNVENMSTSEGMASLDPNGPEPSCESSTETFIQEDDTLHVQSEHLDQKPDQLDQSDSLQVNSKESMDGLPDLRGVSDKNVYFAESSELSTEHTELSELPREDTEPGAVGGIGIYDSESDEDSSYSSSCTSSEGEYDIMWAEQMRGIKELMLDKEDGMPDNTAEEILSAFLTTELVSVTVDSEDESNKGESLSSSLKSTSGFESGPSPLVNVTESQDDAGSAGEMILACFPPSECPFVVDSNFESGNFSENVISEGALEVLKVSVIEKESSNVEGTLERSVDEPLSETSDETTPYDTFLDSKQDTSDPPETEREDEAAVASELNSSIKRTASLRLVNHNGMLKIVDTSETPVTTESIKEAKILRNSTLKGGATFIRQDAEDNVDDSDNEVATNRLNRMVSEVKKMDFDEQDGVRREIHNVCEDIAKLSKRDDDEGVLLDSDLAGFMPTKNSIDKSVDKIDTQIDEDMSSTVIISVDSISNDKELSLEEGRNDEKELEPSEKESISKNGASTLIDSDDQTEASVDETESKPAFVRERRQRPIRLPRFKRYSLDADTTLLSPEDKVHAELTKFESSRSFHGKPHASTTVDVTSASNVSETDGQCEEISDPSPSPPPRSHSSKLRYSQSFTATAGHTRQARKEDRQSKRGRSDRWKTLPNNTFDPQSDKWTFARLSAAFKLSSNTAETVETLDQSPLILITDDMAPTFPNFPQERRAQVALELYTTERSYVRGLETIIQLFKKPCEERKLLDKKESETIFHNIEDIYRVNKDLLFNLLERLKHWHDYKECIGDIFVDQTLKIFDKMKIYAKFCNNYDSAETLYKQKIKRSKEFEAFLNACYEHPVCQPGLNLPAYLITVVQRIPRYLLLLRDLAERTPEGHPDHNNLTKALAKMNNLAVYINNQLQTVVGLRAMDELRLRVIGLKALEGRALIREADVTLNGVKKTRQCLLMNDMLVFAVRGVTRTSEVERTLELTTLWCMDLEGNNPQSPKEDSLEIFTPERSYIMYTGTKTEKKVWLQKLRMAIAMALHGSEATNNDEIERRKSKFTYKDGRIYWGNFVSGKRHGHGVLSWPNQTRYQGNWEDNDRNGKGELTYTNGDKYIGDWLDDKQHGVGRLEYTNGNVYFGDWHQGDMHGMGEIIFKNGDRCKGEFNHNEVQGFGELNCVSGLSYSGSWKHSKKHGKGKLKFANDDFYVGEFENDRISGQGEMQYADGSFYKGGWINNQRHGNGEYRSPDGTHYIGGWSGDHITGKGCMTYSNGDSYDGVWFKNMRFGQGVMKYSNGDSYEGAFVYDLFSNYGTMRYKDGSEYVGNWSNGLRHGKGKMTYLNKSVYEGDWMNGMRHGEGVLCFSKGENYNGHWELDKQHGRGMYEDRTTGYRYEGEWQDGRKAGIGFERSNGGSYEGEWKDNMRHGQGTQELSCGTKFEGGWKENRKHGAGRKTLKTGMMEAQMWQDGRLVDVSSTVLIELPLIQRR